jgi:putative ABC transport system permease protein
LHPVHRVEALAHFRRSARSFLRTPGLALGVVASIAVGIGGNASVYAFVRGLLTRDLPVPEPDRLVWLFGRSAHAAFEPVSYDTYAGLKVAAADPFEMLGAVRESRSTVVIDGKTSLLSIAAVTPEVRDLLGLPPGEHAVVSRELSRSELGRRIAVDGVAVRTGGTDTRVSRVAPSGLEGLYQGRPVDMWMSLPGPEAPVERASRTLWVLGRLRRGVTLADAQAALDALRKDAEPIAVRRYDGLTPAAAAGMDRLRTLLPAAGLAVLFIACANVATFLLARSSAATRDTSVRIALGAGRAHLARQLLADSALVSAAGGAGGILLASWTSQAVPALFFERDAEDLVFHPSGAGLAAAAALCAAITLACGLVPLIDIRFDRPAVVLRREAVGPSRLVRRLRAALVMAQMACCCVLVVTALRFRETLRAALETEAGRRLGHPIAAVLEAEHRFDRPDLGLAYFADAERAAQSEPGVTTAAWLGTLPGGQPAQQPMRIERPGLPARAVDMDVVTLTQDSLAASPLVPLTGRVFRGGDTRTACRVGVVDSRTAETIFEGDAVGRSITDASGASVEIVGVVAPRSSSAGTAASAPALYTYAEQTDDPREVRRARATFQVSSGPEATPSLLDLIVVSSGTFGALGATPIEGRLFPDRPPPGSCRVGVLNAEASETYFGGKAVGGALVDDAGNRTEIVGVVSAPPLHAAQKTVAPAVYLPMAQDFRFRMTLVLGTTAADPALVRSVGRRLDGVPGGTMRSVGTLEDQLRRTSLSTERVATTLAAAFAALGLGLGVLGLHGAMSEAARLRRPDIALRRALGAGGRHVIRAVVVDGARLAAAGTAAGLVLSLPVGRWLARVAPTAAPPVWTWALGAVLPVAAVVVAGVLPARRALAVDPLAILRER